MLRYQSFLPSLPVPPLSQTLALYLTTIKPHLSSEEYSRSEGIVRKFEGSEQGKELQKRLEGRATEGGRENWLSEWFNEASYMGYRYVFSVYHLQCLGTRSKESC
jgi:carnitine O-acetyltransferase